MSSHDWRQASIKGFVYSVAWFVIYYAVVFLADDSPSRAVYGMISSWWLALYISYVFRITWSSILPAAFLYLILRVLLYEPFGKLPAQALSLEYIGHLVASLLPFLSPIIINMMVRFMKERWTARFSIEG